MAEVADATFPVLEAAPHLFLSEQDINQANVSLKTLHNCSCIIWDACGELGLSIRAYATAMEFVQSLLVLTPQATAALQAPNTSTEQRYSYKSVCGGCLITATLSEQIPRKPEDIAQALNFSDVGIIIEMHREALESRGFMFSHEPIPGWVLKLGKVMRIRHKELMYNAWLLSADSCSTFAPLQLPGPAIALACIRLSQVAFQCPNPADIDRLSRDLGISQKDQAKAMLVILNMHEFSMANNLATRGSLYYIKIDDLRAVLLASIKNNGDLMDDVRVPPHCQLNRSDISRQGYARYRFR